ncbi:MAG: PDDEXK nuclease domain-containing protein [Candidatus Cloacimonetes bacterium]|nr:PDDEXK nuclease domain-containing protein [Candidatus Cloacimonadota bacterium]MDY0368050.1 PDDEXK nuclease domain-containing protein [Candidatus Syntrophosphaera sp.]
MKELLHEIRDLIQSARRAVVHSVDLIQVLTNFEIGRRIVEHEQGGEERAEYGKALLKELSAALTAEFGRGFSKRNLEYMRRFYLAYQDRRIAQMPSAQLPSMEKSQMPSGKLTNVEQSPQIWLTASAKFNSPFNLSWSQYVFLISIDNPDERSFYEIEAAQGGWTLPELKRQFNSGLYERLALSRDKEGVKRLAAEGQLVARPEDLLKEPYVLEFLGLDERAKYSESDLESAIIDKLEHFLLELGKGFLFEARQKRFTFDEEHFFVDLVFYNRLLRCYVLIDLKIGKLGHGDLGQMQMYVNYFDRFVKLDEESPTVGIVLCKKKHDALVEITLPKEANIHAREYQLYLPDKELLRRKLTEWGEEVGE